MYWRNNMSSGLLDILHAWVHPRLYPNSPYWASGTSYFWGKTWNFTKYSQNKWICVDQNYLDWNCIHDGNEGQGSSLPKFKTWSLRVKSSSLWSVKHEHYLVCWAQVSSLQGWRHAFISVTYYKSSLLYSSFCST